MAQIGLDVQAMAGMKSGLGVYITQLISHLKKNDVENKYLLLSENHNRGERTYNRLIWENVFLPLQASKTRINILHTPAFAAPFLKGRWRSVATIHDLIGMVFPNHLGLISQWYWGKWLPFVNSRADRIIVDSNCTKQDVIKYLRVSSNKIRVIYLAASDKFQNRKTNSEIESVCHKFQIRRPYALFVGNVEPRKNLVRLIKAFSEVRKTKKIEHQLVIVGFRAWDYPTVKRLTEEHGLTEAVKSLNYIDDEDLVSLYNGGELFVYPSLYEGFGMPILEAMKCGLPVLTSNISSIPEVAGDAAYYVDPYNEKELEAGLITMLTNRSLREDLRQRGFVQADKFSWELTAKKTLEVYQELL